MNKGEKKCRNCHNLILGAEAACPCASKLKALELKMTKSHFTEFEFSPTMHFALNSSQLVLHIFRQKTAESNYKRLHFVRERHFSG